jgi:hypothetical protein
VAKAERRSPRHRLPARRRRQGHARRRRRQVRLGGGAEGSLGKAERSADGSERYELGLSKGSAQLVFDKPGKRVVRLAAPEGTAEVEGDGEATFAWARDARSGRLEVQAGSVQVRYRGQTQGLSAGESARLAKGLSTGPRKAAPVLSLPSGRRVRVFARGLREVALTWPALPGARRVEVFGDAASKDLLLSGAPSGQQVVVPAPAHGQLSWRVMGEGAEPLVRGRASFAPVEGRRPTCGGHPITRWRRRG